MTLRVLALGLAALAVPVSAQMVLTELPVRASAGVGTADREVMQVQVEVEPRWEMNVGQRGQVVTSLRLRLDGRDELEPGEPDFATYSTWSKPLTFADIGTLELRDVYYERLLDRGLLRLGKQQIVWGRLDGIKILDVLNPQTFREFILDDLGDSRISQWSAYLDLTLGDWRAELAWIPDLTGHDIPEPGAWFELRAPRFRFGAPVGAPALPTTTRRTDSLEDSAVAARFSRLMGGVDVSAQFYSGLDHEPLGRIRPRGTGAVVEQYYRRREVVGLSAESSFGSVAWRAELSHQPDRRFNVRGNTGLAEQTLDQVTAGIGADLQLPLDLFANVQLVWDRILAAPDGLVRPEEDRLLTVFLRRGFAYETIRAELRWYHSLTDFDDTLVATLDYELGDDTRLYVSGEWFGGDRTGLFGQFEDQNRVHFGVTRFF